MKRLNLQQIRDLGLIIMIAIVYGVALYYFYPAAEVLAVGLCTIPTLWVCTFKVLAGEEW